MIITQKECINGIFSVPGDKSITHRAILLSALLEGKNTVSGICGGDDCLSSIRCINQLGIDTELNEQEHELIVYGKGLKGFEKPEEPLDCGNSGTTMRLLAGILATCPFESTLTGDDSLRKRPMKRIIEPLSQMGVIVESQDGFAPLTIKGNPDLKGINYDLTVASAQVKSCILLAGLNVNGETTVTEPSKSRDHTEIMLKYLGAAIETRMNTTTVLGEKELFSLPIMIPGDISSAAYIVAAALLLNNSRVIITHVCVNVARTGIISALRDMGAHIEVVNRRKLCGEYVGDIVVSTSELTGTEISGELIPRMIDELPILAVIALFAKGKTIIRDAAELKIKESNRIDAIVTELKKMGARIESTEDGMIIEGGAKLKGAKVNSHNDHRIAMSLAIAGLCAEGETEIENGDCVSISFPGFYEIINFKGGH